MDQRAKNIQLIRDQKKEKADLLRRNLHELSYSSDEHPKQVPELFQNQENQNIQNVEQVQENIENDQIGDQLNVENNNEIKLNLRKKQHRFQAEMLISQEKGLKVLYQQQEKLNLFKPGKDLTEFQKLQKLIKFTQEWHYSVMPRYDFNYFLDRCQKFGTTQNMKTHMEKVRKVHKGDLQWSDINQNEQEIQNNKITNYYEIQQNEQIQQRQQKKQQQNLQQNQQNQMEIEQNQIYDFNHLIQNEVANDEYEILDQQLMDDLQNNQHDFQDFFPEEEPYLDEEDLNIKIKKNN